MYQFVIDIIEWQQKVTQNNAELYDEGTVGTPAKKNQ